MIFADDDEGRLLSYLSLAVREGHFAKTAIAQRNFADRDDRAPDSALSSTLLRWQDGSVVVVAGNGERPAEAGRPVVRAYRRLVN